MKQNFQLNALLDNIENKLYTLNKRSNSCNTRDFSFGLKDYKYTPTYTSNNNLRVINIEKPTPNINSYTSPNKIGKTKSFIFPSPKGNSYLNTNTSNFLYKESSDCTYEIQKQIERELKPMIIASKKDISLLIETGKKDIMNLILNKKEEIRKVKDELLKLQVDVTENKRLIEGKTNQTFELIEQESKKITGNKAIREIQQLQEDIVKLKINLAESQRFLESKANQTFELLQKETKNIIEKSNSENSNKLEEFNNKFTKMINENNKKLLENTSNNKNIELELQNSKERIENFEQKNYTALNKINQALEQNNVNRDKEIQKLNSIYLDLIKANSDYQANNFITLNKLKSEIDTLSKTNEIILNTRLSSLSREISQNYITNQNHEISKKLLQNNIDQVNQRISNFSFASKEELEYVKNEQNSLFNNIQKMGENINKKILNMSANFNNSGENGINDLNDKNMGKIAIPPNFAETICKMELFEELLNDHQKILGKYNERFAEKKDIKNLTDEYIKSNKIFKDTFDNKKKIEKIIAELNDINKTIIPRIYDYIDERTTK